MKEELPMNARHVVVLFAVLFAAGCAIFPRGAVEARTATSGSERVASIRDCKQCPALVIIPAGNFIMGSPANEVGRYDEEGPQRSVHINRLAVGKFDVTRGEWAAFVSATHRKTVGGCTWSSLPGTGAMEPNPKATWKKLGFVQDDTHPVVCVTWDDAQDYVHWLSARTGHRYRLLTEAEWEYAARAGTHTPYPWGSKATHEHANYGAASCCSGEASGSDKWVGTSPVGAFPPNQFGLYDMNGNVMQWVEDCFSPSFSYAGTATDGSAYKEAVTLKLSGDLEIMNGTSSCAHHMLRGGDWGDPPASIRSAARSFAPPPGAPLENYRSAGIGFRVARVLD
jgi:formylglycine-generating enzyme required for sulfatase activity